MPTSTQMDKMDSNMEDLVRAKLHKGGRGRGGALNKYQSATDCPGFVFDDIFGFQGRCKLCKFPKMEHPNDPMAKFTLKKKRKEEERRRRSLAQRLSIRKSFSRASKQAEKKPEPTKMDHILEEEVESEHEDKEIQNEVGGIQGIFSSYSTYLKEQTNSILSKFAPVAENPAAKEQGKDDDEDTDSSDEEEEGTGDFTSSDEMHKLREKHEEEEVEEEKVEVVVAAAAASKRVSKRISSKRESTKRESTKRTSTKRISKRTSNSSSSSTASKPLTIVEDSEDEKDSEDDCRGSSEEDEELNHAPIAKKRASSRVIKEKEQQEDEQEDSDKGSSEEDEEEEKEEIVVAAKRVSSSKRPSLAQRISKRLSRSSSKRTSSKRLSSSKLQEKEKASELAALAAINEEEDDGDASTSESENEEEDAETNSDMKSTGNLGLGWLNDDEDDVSEEDDFPYEEEDEGVYEGWVDRYVLAVYEADNCFYPAQIKAYEGINEDGRKSFEVKFLNRGTQQHNTSIHDIQLLSEEEEAALEEAKKNGKSLKNNPIVVGYGSAGEKKTSAIPENDTIWEACKRGDVEAINTHLQRGINVDLPEDTGVTPLALACESGNEEAVKSLLRFGAEDRYGYAYTVAPVQIRQVLQDFGYGKVICKELNENQLKKVRQQNQPKRSSSKRKHLSASAAQRGAGKESLAPRGASWPQTTAEENIRLHSMNDTNRKSGLKKILCFAGGAK